MIKVESRLFVCASATRDSIKWPAVRLIIKRKDSVKGRRKHLINSTQDINTASARAGRLAGVRWEGHHDLVIKELKKGADHKGKANEIVKINCVGMVKLKGNKPLMFQLKIAKQVNRKGVVSLLKGLKAEHSLLILKTIIEVVGLDVVKCFVKKGKMKGIISNNQLSWLKFDVPGSKIFSIWVIIILVLMSA